MKRLFCTGVFLMAANTFAADEAILNRYGASCAICHASGVANAPKTGDVAAWKPHLAKGDEQLLASIKNGINAMPPKGMCGDCSDAEYKALIQYMATGK
jgi:cytochrome c5